MSNLSRNRILERMLDVVSEESGIPVSDIKSASRAREISDARKVFCTISRDGDIRFELKEIGCVINRDHSTVINNTYQAENLIATDRRFRTLFNRVKLRLAVGDIEFVEFDNIPQI